MVFPLTPFTTLTFRWETYYVCFMAFGWTTLTLSPWKKSYICHNNDNYHSNSYPQQVHSAQWDISHEDTMEYSIQVSNLHGQFTSKMATNNTTLATSKTTNDQTLNSKKSHLLVINNLFSCWLTCQRVNPSMLDLTELPVQNLGWRKLEDNFRLENQRQWDFMLLSHRSISSPIKAGCSEGHSPVDT